MKRFITIFFISCFLVLIPTALAVDSQYCGDTSGARAVYWFDEASGNAADQTANGYTLTNNGTTGFAAGNFNNAADFGTANTTKSFSRIDAVGYTGGDFSMSTWVKMRTELSTDKKAEFVSVHETTTDTELRIIYENVSDVYKLTGVRTKTGVASVYATNNITALGTANWHHIVLTYNNASGVGTVYLDNTALGTTFTQTGSGSGGCDTTTVGTFTDAACSVGAAYFSSAYIDETVFSSNVFSAADVTAIYDRTNPPIGCPATAAAPVISPIILFE